MTMPNFIAIDIDAVYNAARLLRRSLDSGPLPTTVTNYTAPPASVEVAGEFRSAVIGAASALGTALDAIMRYIENHADALKATADSAAEAEASAGQTVQAHSEDLAAARGLQSALTQVEQRAAGADRTAQQDAGAGDVDHDQRGGGL